MTGATGSKCLRMSMEHSIATVIHYCTNDFRFLRKIVDEANKFSKFIIIPVCDHFFNGVPENRALLNRTYQKFPECQFIEFEYHPKRIYNPFLIDCSSEEREWGFFWHSTSRYTGTLFMSEPVDYLLFLDSDEVIDGARFLKWLDQGKYRS
jgi:hypothetical protein